LLILEQSTAPPPPAEWVHVQTDPASTPRARHNHAMVFDEEREVILMHGGRLQDGTVLSDTWQWDGQTWTQLATNGPRVFQQSMAYDPSRGVTVLYGQVDVPGPGRRGMHAMAYDAKRRRVVLFGGYRDCFRCEINDLGIRSAAAAHRGDHTAGERHDRNPLDRRAPLHQLQRRSSLSTGEWQDVGAPTDQLDATVQPEGAASFFRVLFLQP
jgi:hypothetical protein